MGVDWQRVVHGRLPVGVVGHSEMKIHAIHIFMRHKRTQIQAKKGEKGFLGRVILDYKTPVEIDRVKMDIAKTIDARKKKIEYYYVVVVVRRPDRSLGYRTIIPKTLVEA